MNQGTKSELAARLKVSVKRVTSAIERGAISPECIGHDERGQRFIADMERAEAQFRAADSRISRADVEVQAPKELPVLPEGVDPASLGDGLMPPDGIDLNAARTIREWWAALAERADYERKAGRLIEREEVKREAFAVFRATRDAFLALPERVAEDAAAETDPQRVYSRLKSEVTRILDDLLVGVRKIGEAAHG